MAFCSLSPHRVYPHREKKGGGEGKRGGKEEEEKKKKEEEEKEKLYDGTSLISDPGLIDEVVEAEEVKSKNKNSKNFK